MGPGEGRVYGMTPSPDHTGTTCGVTGGRWRRPRRGRLMLCGHVGRAR
jgi:hypothetical protein